MYFDDNDNMWVEGWLIDEDEDGIDDYYGLETKGVHFWKNGSYYGRVLYQNLVTEDETDTENVEQMFTRATISSGRPCARRRSGWCFLACAR